MARIHFVRHGEGVANAGGVTMALATIPLSPLGVAQAATLADVLDVQPSKVPASKYLRARRWSWCADEWTMPQVAAVRL